MNIFINTAYDVIEIFLFNEKFYKLYRKKSINNHTKVLYEVLEEIKEDLNIKLEELKKIYIITGPGSFTGLRVGVVFAKILSYEKDIPIYSVNLLDILYYTNKKSVAIDARGGKYFTYDGNKYRLLSLEEVKKKDIYVTNNIKYNELLNNIDKFLESHVLDVTINYMKEVL